MCHRTSPWSNVLKIYPDKHFEILYHEDNANLVGVAIHKDGRIFLCDIKGRMPVITEDGEFIRDLLDAPNMPKMAPNDLVFDSEGNLYVTDFHDRPLNYEGGIYRFDAADDYKTCKKIAGEMMTPNGIGFSPDEKYMWAAETVPNTLVRFILTPEREPKPMFLGTKRVSHINGCDMCDSLKVDAEGNVYIAMMYGGRLVVTNEDGTIIENVLIEERTEEGCMASPNLALHPTKPEGYILACGLGGSWIYKFEALAPACKMYSRS